MTFFFIFDFLSKIWIINNLPLYETRIVIRNYIELLHVQNRGISFSLFSDLPDYIRIPFLVGVSLIAVVLMIFVLGAIGLPGTSGFIGEFLILLSAFKKNILVAVIASLGVIFAAAYMLWLYKRVIFGKLLNNEIKNMTDLNRSEFFILSSLAILTIFFGFYPEPLLNTIEVSVNNLVDIYDSSIDTNMVKNLYD